MTGYSPDYSMSNNAVAAYDEGLRPASKIPGVAAGLINKHCRYAEWHHASKAYNRVKFYDPAYVRAVFGLETSDDYEVDPAAVAALAAHKAGKAAEVEHVNCRVEWLEWSGSLKRPICTERRAEGCAVTVKGSTATITLPGGTKLVKRLTTRGFHFTAGC